jgi:beta-N-acetylglucosaminidase
MNTRSLLINAEAFKANLNKLGRFLLGILVILLLVSCSQEQESQIKTLVAQIGQTAVAEGVEYAKTELAQAGQTAIAGGVEYAKTEAAHLVETAQGIIPKFSTQLGIYTVETNLNEVDKVTGDELNFAIQAIRPDSGLIGLGKTFVEVGIAESINPVYIAAHAAWESSWGTSRIFIDKNNLFGYGAFDRAPYESAWTFNTKEEGVAHAMKIIKQDYLTEGGSYYNGATLSGMNVYYATDPNWANGIASVMNSLAAKINSQRSQ